MSSTFPKEGILVALLLPFDADGRIMEAALARHLAWLRSRGIHGVLALGSTGEFPMLTVSQRMEALETVARLAAPLPVIANISDIQPKAVAELGRFSRKLGLAGVAIMPPHFFPASQADQLAHFSWAAEKSELPVMLYNFPELTCNRIAPETIEAFAQRHQMAAIKQSGREFSYHPVLIDLGRKHGFSVFSGADTRLPEVFQMGAAGCIGGLVNMVPELMVEQFNVYKKGQPGELEPTATRMKDVGALVDRFTFPQNVAAGLRARGFEAGYPKVILSDETKRISAEVTEALKARFAEWGLEEPV